MEVLATARGFHAKVKPLLQVLPVLSSAVRGFKAGFLGGRSKVTYGV